MEQNPKVSAQGTPAARPQMPGGATDLRYAAELIKAVGGDIAQLAQVQNEELDHLDSLAKQIAYVKEVLDYGLFVSPDQVERQEDLYPFAAWLQRKFKEVSSELRSCAETMVRPSEKDEASEDVSVELMRLNEKVEQLGERLQDVIVDTVQDMTPKTADYSEQLSNQLRASAESHDEKLTELYEYVQRVERRQGDSLEAIRKQLDKIKEQSALSPYDDFDVQVEELRMYLKEQTARWRIQENIFFGAVILMLFVNMGMLLWLNVTH